MRRLLLLLLALSVYATQRLSAQQPAVDVQSYHFRINLPDTGSTIRGWATVLYHTRAGYDDTLRLDLIGMAVRRVFDIYSMRQLPIQYDGRVLRIATRTGTVRRLRGVMVEYGGSPQNGLSFQANARGRRAIYGDNWPNRARYWLPTVDHPSDKARVLWSIQIPRGWRAVANQPECRMDGRVRRCNESAPIPTYTMVLGATEQLTRAVRRPLVSSGGRTVPIEVRAYPEDSAYAADGPLRRVTEIAEVLERIIGPFPYAKLTHVQSSTRFGGGMENSSVIFYAERRFVEQNLRESTVRHETAHQWFGDAVTPADWPHLWLSEGFAVYFAAVSGAALDGDTLLTNAMRAAAENYFASAFIDRPVIDTTVTDPNQLLGANSYQKGAWVLHMLRGVMGDSAFFRGIRDYYRTYRDSSVTSDQFRRVMERSSRDTLGWFFRQWLRQPGYPQLELGWRRAPQSVVLTVRQAQSEEWGRFRIPRLPIRLVLAGGRVLDREMTLNERYGEQTHTIMLNAGDEVDEVMMDPDGTLLLRSVVTRRDVP